MALEYLLDFSRIGESGSLPSSFHFKAGVTAPCTPTWRVVFAPTVTPFSVPWMTNDHSAAIGHLLSRMILDHFDQIAREESWGKARG